MTAIRDRSAAAKKGWDRRGRGRKANERHAAAKARHDDAVAKATKAIDAANKATADLKARRTVANHRKSVAAIGRANRATAAMQKAKSSLDRAEAHVAKKEAKAKAKAEKVEARAKAKAEKSAAKAKVKQEKQIAREKAKAAKAAEKAKVKAEKVAAKAAAKAQKAAAKEKAKAEKVAAKEKVKADRAKAKAQKRAGKNHDVMPSGLTPKEQAEATAVHKVFGQYHTLQGLKDKLISNFTHKDSGISGSGTVTLNHDRAELNGSIMKDGKPVGQFFRVFSRTPSGKVKVKHVNFVMDEGVAGKGVGRAMVEQSIKTYHELGVKEISLSPHWIGRYTWATLGFRWKAKDAAVIRRKLASYLVKEHGKPKDAAKALAKELVANPAKLARYNEGGFKVSFTTHTHAGQVHVKDAGIGKHFLLTVAPSRQMHMDLSPKGMEYTRFALDSKDPKK